MGWVPALQVLRDLIDLLAQADSPDSAVQRQLLEAVNRFSKLPDEACYCCHVFVDLDSQPLELRQRAGILLKGAVTRLLADTPDGVAAEATVRSREMVRDYVQKNVVRALYSDERAIRETAGNVLASIASKEGISEFPDLLPVLSNLLSQANPALRLSALSALAKMIEDEVDRSDARCSFESPAGDANVFVHYLQHELIPQLLQLCVSDSASTEEKVEALKSLNHLQRGHLLSEGDIFNQFFDQYWTVLGTLALDPSSDVKLKVLQGMSNVVLLSPDSVLSSIDSIIQFLCRCLVLTESYQVRLEALDVLTSLVRTPEAEGPMRNVLATLLPLLVGNCRFCEWDYLQMDPRQLEDDNAAVEDRPEDIAPRFHHSANDEDESSDDEENRGSGAAAKSTWGAGWTVRKGSAMLIDNLSTIYKDELLPHLLPVIEQRLQVTDPGQWEIRESAALVLGAIARGCQNGLAPYLPGVLDIIFSLCDDTRPVLRSIALWCLSRFSRWIYPQPKPLELALKTLLSHILDKNKDVQQAACSALAVFGEEAREALIPYKLEIIAVLSRALQTYQIRNKVVLLDATATFADAIGPAVDCEEFRVCLWEPLLRHWSNATLRSPTLVALFEFFSCVVTRMPHGIQDYVAGIVDRTLKFLDAALTALGSPDQAHREGCTIEREVAECCLDLLSGICDAAQGASNRFLGREDMAQLLLRACQISNNVHALTVKQTSFALIGDLAEKCPELVKLYLNSFLQELIPHIYRGSVSVCNNASWAIGQIALHVASKEPTLFEPYIPVILDELIKVIEAPFLQRSLARSACITIGRLGLTCPTLIGPRVEPFLDQWCAFVESATNDNEKWWALEGMCSILKANEKIIQPHVASLLAAFVSPYLPIASGARLEDLGIPANFDSSIRTFLHSLNQGYPAEWDAAVKNSPPMIAGLLGQLK